MLEPDMANWISASKKLLWFTNKYFQTHSNNCYLKLLVCIFCALHKPLSSEMKGIAISSIFFLFSMTEARISSQEQSKDINKIIECTMHNILLGRECQGFRLCTGHIWSFLNWALLFEVAGTIQKNWVETKKFLFYTNNQRLRTTGLETYISLYSCYITLWMNHTSWVIYLTAKSLFSSCE